MEIRTKSWLSKVAFSLSLFVSCGFILASHNQYVCAQEAGAPVKQEKSDKKDSSKKESGAEKGDSKKQSEEKKSDSKKEESSTKKGEKKAESSKSSSSRRRRVPSYEKFQKFTPKVRELLSKQIETAAKATVEVFCDGKKEFVSLGTIIDKRGFVMTKASRLNGLVRCKLANGKSVPAIVCGIDEATDLALLRLQAYNLTSIELTSKKHQSKEGHWVLSPSSGSDLLSYGVLSVAERKIRPVPGFIGINMQPATEGVTVTSVVPRSAAEKYGLKTGDKIVMIGTKKVVAPADLSKILRTKRPGDVVALKVLRGKEKKDMSFRIVLGNRMEDTPQAQRSMRQNTMSGAISKRRDDFPVAIQHDTVLRPRECGGPVTDLEGTVIGVNIARGGRVKSYALPLPLVEKVYKKLVTGEFSPEVVYKDKIDGFTKILGNLESRSKGLSDTIDNLAADQKKAEKVVEGQEADVDLVQSEMKALKAKMADLEKKLKDKKEVLSKGKLKRIQIGSGIRKNKRKLSSISKQKDDIQKKLNGLLFGADR